MYTSVPPVLLIVEDDLHVIDILLEYFRDDFEIRTASTEKQAINLARHLDRKADLLMDLHLGGSSGIEVLKKMREIARHPIIAFYMSADASEESAVKALEAGGAVTYFVKPLKLKLLRAHLKVVAAEFFETLKRSHRDPLTGLLNRSGFTELSIQELKSAVRNPSETSALFIDIDEFKETNDQFGHEKGDRVICEVADCITEHVIRHSDLIARWSGDEYVVLLPTIGADDAQVVARRIDRAVRNLEVMGECDESIPVRVSIGAATLPRERLAGVPGDLRDILAELIAMADKAMYEVKNARKGHVETG